MTAGEMTPSERMDRNGVLYIPDVPLAPATDGDTDKILEVLHECLQRPLPDHVDTSFMPVILRDSGVGA